MKILYQLIEKIRYRCLLDAQEEMLKDMELWQLLGYKIPDDCVKQAKKNIYFIT